MCTVTTQFSSFQMRSYVSFKFSKMILLQLNLKRCRIKTLQAYATRRRPKGLCPIGMHACWIYQTYCLWDLSLPTSRGNYISLNVFFFILNIESELPSAKPDFMYFGWIFYGLKGMQQWKKNLLLKGQCKYIQTCKIQPCRFLSHQLFPICETTVSWHHN